MTFPHSHVTVTGSKSQASGCPMGLFQPDVLHLNTGCWSCVGPLTAIHCNVLTISELVIYKQRKNKLNWEKEKPASHSQLIKWLKSFKESQITDIYLLWGAGMAQWWERSPLTSAPRVRFPDPASSVGWVFCWLLSLLRGFFSGFPPSTETNISKFQFDLDREPF